MGLGALWRREIVITHTLPATERAALKAQAAAFQTPTLVASGWQMASSFGPFLLTVGAMYALRDIGAWWADALSLALAVLAAGFVVRIFIIQHDCGHGSFFRSGLANSLVGSLCGVVTLTPFAHWRRQHAGHHGNWNNLDRRASGADIYSTCMTVDEYQALDRGARWRYRLLRHPFIYLLLIPPLVFLVIYRFAFDTPTDWDHERRAVYLNNAAIFVVVIGLGLLLGFGNVAAVHLPIVAATSIIGVFLFSVQHRFEKTLWMRAGAWNAVDASLHGSSFLKLPRVLQWFTGNIGYHHVHHLNSRIPNYRLRACHDAIAELQDVPVLTLGSALGNNRHALWDEGSARMISFAAAEAGAARVPVALSAPSVAG